MTTRLRKPSIFKGLAVTVALLGFQGYMVYSAIGGQFGVESHKDMLVEIEDLKAQSAALQVEIDAMRHRASLFVPESLDPDILTERARSLLSMSRPNDILIMVDPRFGQPLTGSREELAEDQLTSLIQVNSAL